jgi:uncharacterized protein YhaN
LKVTGFHINGFGLFQDLRVEGLGPGLSLFHGENESGKSTLLGFLRGILFGFPDGRSNENLYAPLSGGKHGGSVTVETRNGQSCVIERYAGPGGGRVSVSLPGERQKEKGYLAALLGTATRALFKNVFGFSLAELQELDTLYTDEVRQALFSAGAGVNPSRLSRLRSLLDKGEADLFKPGGTKPKINGALSKLMAIQKEKRGLEDFIGQYDQAGSRLLSLEKEISDLEGKGRPSGRIGKRAKSGSMSGPTGSGFPWPGKSWKRSSLWRPFRRRGSAATRVCGTGSGMPGRSCGKRRWS